MNKDLQQLKDKLEGMRTAMLATRTNDGLIHSRPMYVQEFDDSGHLWFLGQESVGNAEDVTVDPNVNISFCDPDKRLFASVAGSAVTSKNKEDIERHKNVFDESWFPKDSDKRGLIAIRVQIQEAEVWDGDAQKMVQVFGLSEALDQPASYQTSRGEDRNRQH